MTTIDIDHISENNPPMQKVSVAAEEPTIIENLIVTISNLAPYSGEEFLVEGPVIAPVINEVPILLLSKSIISLMTANKFNYVMIIILDLHQLF